MKSRPVLRASVLAVSLAFLAACDSAEDRAEKHYQSGIELLEAGDVDRAMVEFRNVFTLVDSHREARTAYAKAAQSVGNIPEAYANFLRIVEEFPDDLEARQALTDMAIRTQNWDEAERHGQVLIEANADTQEAQVASLALQFRSAVVDQDAPRISELTREAAILFNDLPDNFILHRILIEGYTSMGEIDAALDITERAIATSPDDMFVYRVKGNLLAQKNDLIALEEHLRDTVAQFPEDDQAKAALIQLLSAQGEIGRAQDFLRDELADAADKKSAHVNLITFIRLSEGNEAALTEIDTAIATYEDNALFRALKAGLLFDSGDGDGAVAMLETVLEEADASETADPSETNRFRVMLAQMLGRTGNEVGARQLVERVLADDPSQTEALKMSAEALIESDQPDEALSALRTVLDQAPEDAEAMTLMARAHQRNGNIQLAQDLLSLAVEASGSAPAESTRYAQLLLQQERYRPAEDVLINALRVNPGNLRLLELLGELYLQTEDWTRARQVVDSLRRTESPEVKATADRLQLQIVARREGPDEAIGFLERLSEEDGGNNAAKIALIRARLGEGKPDEALAIANELVAASPDNASLRLVLGNTQFASRDFEAAEATIRGVVEDTGSATAGLQLVRVLSAQGRSDDARGTIDELLTDAPDNPDLLWAKASFLERANDIDGAIAIYEELYVQNTNSPVIANNLASLLATYRDDDESLERAYTVARRLSGTNIPPFQDTYGWIQFRRGDVQEALRYLEPAALRLQGDPIVQYHYAKALQAAGRDDDAKNAFQRALDIAGESDSRAQIEDARAQIELLSAEN